MSRKTPETFGDDEQNIVSYGGTAPRSVELPFVRQGTHSYQVRYAYYSKEHGRGDDVRKEAWRTEEAWSAADAVVQTAIYVDSLYASSRCKILEVKPCLKST